MNDNTCLKGRKISVMGWAAFLRGSKSDLYKLDREFEFKKTATLQIYIWKFWKTICLEFGNQA